MNTPPGWKAELNLGFSVQEGRTILARRHHRGPLTVQKPLYAGDGVCQVCVLHPPAGVVGGDQLELTFTADPKAQVLVTTPAASQFYRSDSAWARQSVQLNIGQDASLEWLPQETIFFQGAKVRSTVQVNLHEAARFIGWEFSVLGRPAAGEGFDHGQVILDWRMYLADQPMLLERLNGDNASLHALSGWGGRPMAASLWAYPATPSLLERIQTLSAHDPDTGVSLLGQLLVVRSRANSMSHLHRLLRAIWACLRPEVIGSEPLPPRIWNT
ncbi:MAG: urease accessory protein UreD [Methylococcaceae bacterium]